MVRDEKNSAVALGDGDRRGRVVSVQAEDDIRHRRNGRVTRGLGCRRRTRRGASASRASPHPRRASRFRRALCRHRRLWAPVHDRMRSALPVRASTDPAVPVRVTHGPFFLAESASAQAQAATIRRRARARESSRLRSSRALLGRGRAALSRDRHARESRQMGARAERESGA